MKRRQAIFTSALLLGGTAIGSSSLLSGCSTPARKRSSLSKEDLALLDEVGETILPETKSSPGAKAARIGEYMNTMVTDCYEPELQEVFYGGLDKLEASSNAEFNKGFMELSADQKTKLLIKLDKEAKEYNSKNEDSESPHYFSLIKNLTMRGYFTSEPGATKALRYVAIPGRYDGCTNYVGNEPAWAQV